MLQRPALTRAVLRTAAKYLSHQHKAQSSKTSNIAPKPHINHLTLPAVSPNQQTVSIPKATPSVQICIPQPQSTVSDKPIILSGSSDNNKIVPQVLVSKPPDPNGYNQSKRSSKVSKPNRRHTDTVLLKNTFSLEPLKISKHFHSLRWYHS